MIRMEAPKTKCKYCGKLIDISESKKYKEMRVKCQVAVEELRESNKSMNKLRRHKVGQILAMHLMIKRLYELMTPEQRKKASRLSQQLRDEFKKIERMN